MTLVSSIFPGQKNNGLLNKSLQKNPELRDKMRMLSKQQTQSDSFGTSYSTSSCNSILQSSQNYGSQIRAQRQNAQATALKVKKLKYKFKDISSKIISSKTSHSAKQVAGQAKREVLRLKNEKRKSGDEDTAEIDAAIEHAKAMERVAKKKAKHLEEEELVKVGEGTTTSQVDLEEEDYELEDVEKLEEEDVELDEEELEMSEFEDMMELTMDMTTELTEELQSMMEELDELLMMDVAPGEEMSPEDLKELKLKHRNKEMKDIVKADADYMKAVFDSLEKGKTSDAVPISSGAMATPVSVDVSMPMPVIDVSV